MPHLNFTIIQPWHRKSQMLIANWYLAEWNIPLYKTMDRMDELAVKNNQFQLLMTLDDKPIATGGVYDHIGLLDMEPSLGKYHSWLAQVYTSPGYRARGYGSALCTYIHQHAAATGIEKLHLATPDAAAFYKKLGWRTSETMLVGRKKITIMEKVLHPEQKIFNEYKYDQNNY